MTLPDHLSASPALLLDTRCSLGESPRWHARENRLYWVDIDRREMLRWDAASGAIERRSFDAPVACFAFRKGGSFILGMKDGCALLDAWDGTPTPFGAQPLAEKPRHRMNDGRTDPAGRFWVGSLNGAKDVEDATLYRLGADSDLCAVESGMTTCNGAAFTIDGRRFAHSDTPSHRVRLYDCDPESGVLSNNRTFHQFERGVGPGLGRPDGGSFDEEGCYWVALFDGWRVVRLSPDGALLADIALPVQRPTMIAFGGPDRRTAFITTATTGLDETALATQPQAGGIFTFRVDVPGVPEFDFGG
jgi:sugar lactone lactonase YvrE